MPAAEEGLEVIASQQNYKSEKKLLDDSTLGFFILLIQQPEKSSTVGIILIEVGWTGDMYGI